LLLNARKRGSGSTKKRKGGTSGEVDKRRATIMPPGHCNKLHTKISKHGEKGKKMGFDPGKTLGGREGVGMAHAKKEDRGNSDGERTNLVGRGEIK